jgi:DHA1 family tetracycline resistance protein-like MFS transporter
MLASMRELPESHEAVSVTKLGVVTVVRRLWFLFVVGFFTIFMYCLVAPLMTYAVLTFFAQSYGGADCMKTPTARPCKLAANDAVIYNSVVGCLVSLVSVVSAISLGSSSDSIGRRLIFLIKGALSCAMIFTFVLYNLVGLTLWVFLSFKPLASVWDINGVLLATITDLVPERELRGPAMSITISLLVICILISLGLSAVLPITISLYMAVVAGIIKLVFYLSCFPETLRKAPSRSAKQRKGILGSMKAAAQILVRSAFILRTALVTVIGAISSVGSGLVASSFVTVYLGVTREQQILMGILIICSVLLTLGVLAEPVVAYFGYVRTFQVCQFGNAAMPALLCLCSEPWHVMLLLALLMGPLALQFPIISALKSNLVNEDEQGLIQGALTSLVNLASGLAAPVFGWLYDLYTSKGADESKSAVIPPLLISASIGLLAALVSLTLPLKVPEPQDTNGSDLADSFL